MIIKLPTLDYRIPNWKYDKLVQRNCPICNSNNSDVKYIRPDNLNIKFCKICNTYFVSPCPSETELSSFYLTYDDNHRRATDVSGKELLQSYIKLNPFLDIRIQELSSIMNIKNSKVLDIGFGRVEFLYKMMKLGAIPYGIELDSKAIAYAKFLGINNVYQGNIFDLNNDNKYNLVTLNDILEHSLEPMTLLKRAQELLENNGILLIWTPNGYSANYEDNPKIFMVDLEHMQYLSPQSCLYIAEILGLKILHLEMVGLLSLKGIEKQFSKRNFKTIMMKLLKSFPGFSYLNNLRKTIIGYSDSDRKGLCRIFCIMKRE